MKRSNIVLKYAAPLMFCTFLLLSGCALFVSHYDAGAYQNFTNLKAFHLKFLEDNTAKPGNTFDETKVKATCDTGDLKFREATEYAAGKHDDSRVRAIHYLDNVFESDCRRAMKDKKLFSVVYADEKTDVVKLNYDLAIRGESSRVGSVVK
ncbi:MULTISPECIES: hypothetical protein [Citrobacter]|uniref:hypothetical protein n=1 Tax=Citrobacter TaxID=544 RepID=UPI000E2EC4AC|nr:MULTISPECIES: hypothetical protein [Citrobacter]MBJ8927802.1 hypothetical protein [Citrobacter sp. FDAARGOS_156]MCO4162518.1 hypothetical protein [Citrobacter youngae]